MGSCDNASTCHFPGSILYSVHLECCVKWPEVMVVSLLCHGHMGHLGFTSIAQHHLDKDTQGNVHYMLCTFFNRGAVNIIFIQVSKQLAIYTYSRHLVQTEIYQQLLNGLKYPWSPKDDLLLCNFGDLLTLHLAPSSA